MPRRSSTERVALHQALAKSCNFLEQRLSMAKFINFEIFNDVGLVELQQQTSRHIVAAIASTNPYFNILTAHARTHTAE